MFIVSTSSPDVMEAFRQLTEQQYSHHHQKPNSFPQYILPNILKYYVLVHDVYEKSVEESKAHELFTQIQNYYGSGICHFLQINSRNSSSSNNDEADASTAEQPNNSAIVDHWLGHSHR